MLWKQVLGCGSIGEGESSSLKCLCDRETLRQGDFVSKRSE